MLTLTSLMHALAQGRPVFYLEADFQLGLAWTLQRMFPDAQVRLELPVVVSDEGRVWADELKYGKRDDNRN